MSEGLFLVTTNSSPYFYAYAEDGTGCSDAAFLPNTALSADPSPIAGNSDGTKLALRLSAPPYIGVYDLAGHIQLTLGDAGVSQSLYEYAWSPDGSMLAVATSSSTNPLVVYNTSTWTRITVPGLPTGSGGVSVAWSPDGSKLALIVSSSTTPLTVFNVADWSKVTIPSQPKYGLGLFSPNGSFFAVAGAYLTVYNTADWSKVTLTGGAANTVYCGAAAWSQSGDKFVVACNSSPYHYLYDTTTWSYSSPFSFPSRPYGFAFGESKLCAVGNSATHRIRLYNLSDWSVAVNNLAHTGLSVRWSPRRPRYLTTGTQAVLGADGLPAVGRKVRFYKRDTGVLLGESVTDSNGQFERPFMHDQQLQIVVLDDDAGDQYNDLVLGRLVPGVLA